jgi:PAS domain S-box-containing protein
MDSPSGVHPPYAEADGSGQHRCVVSAAGGDGLTVVTGLFADLIESTSEGVVVIDHARRFAFVNRAAERMLRRRRQRLVGRRVADVLPAVAASPLFEMAARCLDAGRAESREMWAAPLKRWLRVRCESHARGALLFLTDVGRLRRAESERDAARTELAGLRRSQRRLLRDVLATVTDGRLRLCDGELDLPAPLPAAGDRVNLDDTAALSLLRRHVAQAAEDAQLGAEARHGLLLAAGEAAMNALVHAGSAEAEVCADPERRRVQVWVRDRGAGIAEDTLHRATLEKGYSSAGTLGFGFTLMLRLADRVHLWTGAAGTTVVIEHGAIA